MAKPVTLSNGRVFPTQGKAEAHFRSMRDLYRDEDRISDRDHHQDLVALLDRYDALILDGPAKSEGGVDYFFRRLNVNQERGSKWSSPGFWVMRKDGTATDFSFIDAVRGQPKGGARDVYDACRNAVAEPMSAAKDRHFERHADDEGVLACEFTGQLVTRDEAHLDHAAPFFIDIVNAFRAERGWEDGPPHGVVTPSADGQTTTIFLDPALEDAFVDFHRARARIRVISKSGAPLLSERKLRTEVSLLVSLD